MITQKADSLKLLELAQSGDKHAQQALVENNVGLIWSIVKKFLNRGHDADDLFQIGAIGMLKAIQKFNHDFNVQFSTYAVPMIIGEIKRFIRDDGPIKVSRSCKELSLRAKIAKERLQRDLGVEPTIREVADALQVTPEELVFAMDAGAHPESLNAPIGDGDSMSLIDKVDTKSDIESDIVNRIGLSELISTLEPRERQIIILRYYKMKTQSEIAALLGISQVQVSRIEKRLLLELRAKIS